MRDFVLIYINGRRYQVKGTDAFLSLADFLRLRLGLVGTKIVCNEGDCGACSVLTGRPKGESIVYRVVDSCIQFMFQLDGCHIVTVEGLKLNGQLHPIQQAMVRCHASQCGFCTPGFLVMLAGLREYKDRLDDADVRQGLTGNLCRCTGYVQIIEAALALDDDAGQRMGELYPPQSMLVELRAHASTSICVRCTDTQGERIFFSPTDLPTAIQCLADHPRARIVAGATDVGVQINKGTLRPAVIVDLNRVPDLDTVHVENGVLVAGARSSWTDIEHACQDVIPEFHRILTLFGSPQIRNAATIGGNIANGSPVADSLPFLLVMEAELILEGPAGMRQININDFYVGYKQIDLRLGELITRVRIPIPTQDQILGLYKVSRRRDLDIASFTAAILLRLDENRIDSAAVALGAVGPTVIRARQTESFLTDQAFTEDNLRQAGEIAATEVSPQTDVRGSQDFRYQLTRNVFLKFYHEAAVTAV